MVKTLELGLVLLSTWWAWPGYTVQAGCVNNRCDWEPWKAWSACSATCGGGQKVRSRDLCCKSTWTFATCVARCSFHIPDASQARSCAQTCTSGQGSWSGVSCSCNNGFFGSCCSNRITCGDPGQVTNAVRNGSTFTSGASVHYTCDQFYNQTAGTATRRCLGFLLFGIWSRSRWSGSRPVCTFVNTRASNPCQNGATCVDGLNQYTCQCEHGWSGTHCEIDVLPPVYDACPSNRSHFVKTPRVEINWTEPIFSDAHGQTVYRTSNYPENKAVLPWGEFVVQYTGIKPSNGLQTECKFTVSVYPTPCTPLSPPTNGAFACNGWNAQFGEVCLLMCEEDWEPEYGVDITQNYVCGASGNFIPRPTFQGCTERQFDANSRTSEERPYFYNGTCQNAAAQAEIRQNYIGLLKISLFPEMCTDWDEQCNADGVKIICSE